MDDGKVENNDRITQSAKNKNGEIIKAVLQKLVDNNITVNATKQNSIIITVMQLYALRANLTKINARILASHPRSRTEVCRK